MRLIATLLAALGLALALVPSGLAAQRRSALDVAVLQQINQVRREHGLGSLIQSAKLSAAAAQHTREMATDGYFAHESVDQSPFWKRIRRWYPAPRSSAWSWSVGENLLWSSPDVSAQDTVTLWMNSPEYRANLLDRTWREVGISAMHFDAAPGVYDGQPVTIVTADFGARG